LSQKKETTKQEGLGDIESTTKPITSVRPITFPPALQHRAALIPALLRGSHARDSRAEELEVKEVSQSATPKYFPSVGGEGSSGRGRGPREPTALPTIPKKYALPLSMTSNKVSASASFDLGLSLEKQGVPPAVLCGNLSKTQDWIEYYDTAKADHFEILPRPSGGCIVDCKMTNVRRNHRDCHAPSPIQSHHLTFPELSNEIFSQEGMEVFKLFFVSHPNEFGGEDSTYSFDILTMTALFKNKTLALKGIEGVLVARVVSPDNGTLRKLIDPDGNQVVDHQTGGSKTFITRDPHFTMQIRESRKSSPSHASLPFSNICILLV